METVLWKNQQVLIAFLLMNSEQPWKILVVVPHGSMERMNNTIESYTTWLDDVLLTVINTKKLCCSEETSAEV